jgi:RNA polymerase sigma factor (TIGR02999 family)
MEPTPASEVTQLLLAWREGKAEALHKLVPIVYGELRKIAHAYMRREEGDRLLQTTALVNEAYLRLVDAARINWQNRSHFYGICARLMRRILVEQARAEHALKRGGGHAPLNLDESWMIGRGREKDLLALEDALNDLERFDERKTRIVELRFYGGLTVEETAEVLGVAPITVMREWEKTKAWLYRAMTAGDNRV